MITIPILGPSDGQLRQQIVKVPITATVAKGQAVSFLVNQDGDMFHINSTADGEKRCFGIALEDGVSGDRIDVCVGGICDAKCTAQLSDGSTGSAISAADYLFVNATPAKASNLFEAGSGERIIAQVCYGEATLASGSTATKKVLVTGAFVHTEV